jgi:hypothetical protein
MGKNASALLRESLQALTNIFAEIHQVFELGVIPLGWGAGPLAKDFREALGLASERLDNSRVNRVYLSWWL